jgi:nitroreductase
MRFDHEKINDLLKSRRSIFPQDYTGEKVEDAIVTQIIENARWAPTHKLTQPWRFIIFSGDGIKSLAKAQADLYKKVSEPKGTFKEDSFQKLLTKPLLSSHIIVVCMHRDEKKSVPEIEETGAVFCAIQNMYLTTTAYGIGGYLSTGGIINYEEAKELFGLTPDDKVLGFFHIGIPKKQYPEGKRKEVAEIAQWVTT